MSEQELLDAEETQETETTEIATVDPDHVDPDDCGKFELSLKVERKELRQLGNFIRKARGEVLACEDEVERMALQSSFIQTLRQAVKGPMLDALMQLQNTPLGFKTDNRGGDGKDSKGPYQDNVVADVAIEAFSKGLRMVGNEVNIISGQLYATKEGFKRLLDELEGFSNLELVIGIADIIKCGRDRSGNDKFHARVPASAKWVYQGQPGSLDCHDTEKGDFRIALKWYNTDTDDLLRGKAESKLLRRIYAIVTGQEVGFDPHAEADVVDSTAETVSRVPVSNPEPPAPLIDRLEGFLNERLPSASSKAEVSDVEKLAMSKLDKTDASQDEYAACKEYIETLCQARRDDIHNSRGERSNGS